MTRLFVQRGDWCDRNPGKVALGLLLFISTSEWLVTALAGMLP